MISEALKSHFTNWGYNARYVDDFKNILQEILGFAPHIILLDISLPFYNGYYWCQEIRKVSNIPIVFVSSAADKMNIIMAVEKGGDDYITKPFDINVITAKIQALLRRTYEFDQSMDVIEHNGAFLSLNDMVIINEDKKHPLTKNEFRIMQILMERKNSVVTRNDIIIRLWENDEYIDDNTLTVNINRLRKKLDEIGLQNFITTKKGIGYMVGKA